MAGKRTIQDRIKNQVVMPVMDQQAVNGMGIVLGYDELTNTANILMSKPSSDMPGELLRDVPCPVQLGVQTVYPEKGRQCWVTFKNNDPQFPYVTHFFSSFYDQYDNPRQSRAHAPLPNFIYEI